MAEFPSALVDELFEFGQLDENPAPNADTGQSAVADERPNGPMRQTECGCRFLDAN
jgi:hypothetical protein